MGTKKTTTSEKQHAVTTPNVPDWIKGPQQDYMARIQQYMGTDPQQFVAGPGALQKAVFGMSGGILDRLGKRFNMPGGQMPQQQQPSWMQAGAAEEAAKMPQMAAPAVMPQQQPVNNWQQFAPQTDPRVQQQMDLLNQNLSQAGGYPNGLFDWMK